MKFRRTHSINAEYSILQKWINHRLCRRITIFFQTLLVARSFLVEPCSLSLSLEASPDFETSAHTLYNSILNGHSSYSL